MAENGLKRVRIAENGLKFASNVYKLLKWLKMA